jgi:hypothetical protein
MVAVAILLGASWVASAGASTETEKQDFRAPGGAKSMPTRASTGADAKNDYPTAARADYVFACMATNGQTQQALQKCACSIDVIASLIPYERYVQSETILRMQLVGGEKSEMFRGAAWMKEILDDLRRAQTEAEARCF